MSGKSTAKGSRPTNSRAHHTAWPRPSGCCWRVKAIVPAFGRSCRSSVYRFVSSTLRERRLELVGDIEMVCDHALVAAGDEDEMLDPRLACLVDHILQRRPVDDGQHLLRHRLGGGEESRAEAGHGKDSLAERIYHANDLSIPSTLAISYLPDQRSDRDRDAGLSVMSVLVTGGAGFIGGHMVLELADRGERVTVLDDLSTGFDWAVHPKAELVIGDIGDRVLLDRLMKTRKIRTVMHFAGSIVVPDSVADPLGYYLNNTVKSRELIAAAVANGVESFVFSSTSAVYGAPEKVPVTEETPLNPMSPYGASKAMTERMLTDSDAAYGLRSVVLRYFNVAGADPEGRAGQSTRGATHLLKVALEVATGRREHVAVFGTDYDTPDGTGIRDYIHVSDLVGAHAAALDHLRGGGESLLLNCGYGHGYSVLELLDAVQRVSGRPLDIRARARRAGDVPVMIAAADRIKQTLAWTPRFDDIETIVAHALSWEEQLQKKLAA